MNITATRFLIPILILLAVSCKNTKVDNSHLPAAVMQKILLDVNLAESFSITVKDTLHRGGTKNLDSLAVYYKDIFAHHHITAEEFTSSLAWYKDHPDELDTLYNNIIPVVGKMQNLPKPN